MDRRKDRSRPARPYPTIATDPVGSFVLVTTGHTDLYGSRAQMEDLLSAIEDYSLEIVFSVASKVAQRLSGSGPAFFDRNLQLDIAGSILPPDAQSKLATFLAGRSDSENLVLFQERQLPTLLKIACLRLAPDAPNRADNAHGIGRALLMVTDLLDAEAECATPTS